jgi:hypothetical protein
VVEPRWSPDGKELFYLSLVKNPKIELTSVPVQAGPDGGLRIGTPAKILEFEGRFMVPYLNLFQYSVHPDGKRLLVNMSTDTAPPELHVITNWQKLLPQVSR